MHSGHLTLRELMAFPLPSIYEQKRLHFRPTYGLVHHIYEMVNYEVFDNELKKPHIYLLPRCRKYWGMCIGDTKKYRTGSYCEIRLMDKWISMQWLVAIIAHEMAHQYQWDIMGPERAEEGKEFLMSHGPSFFQFRDTMREHDIPLKTAHSQRRWYKHQNLFKA